MRVSIPLTLIDNKFAVEKLALSVSLSVYGKTVSVLTFSKESEDNTEMTRFCHTMFFFRNITSSSANKDTCPYTEADVIGVRRIR